MMKISLAFSFAALALMGVPSASAGPLKSLTKGTAVIVGVPVIAHTIMLCKENPECAQKSRQRYEAGKKALKAAKDTYRMHAPGEEGPSGSSAPD